MADRLPSGRPIDGSRFIVAGIDRGNTCDENNGRDTYTFPHINKDHGKQCDAGVAQPVGAVDADHCKQGIDKTFAWMHQGLPDDTYCYGADQVREEHQGADEGLRFDLACQEQSNEEGEDHLQAAGQYRVDQSVDYGDVQGTLSEEGYIVVKPAKCKGLQIPYSQTEEQ